MKKWAPTCRWPSSAHHKKTGSYRTPLRSHTGIPSPLENAPRGIKPAQAAPVLTLLLSPCYLARATGRSGQLISNHSSAKMLVATNRPVEPTHLASTPPSTPPANRPSDCKVL